MPFMRNTLYSTLSTFNQDLCIDLTDTVEVRERDKQSLIWFS